MTGTEKFKEDCPLRWEKSLVSSLKIMNGMDSGGNGRDSRGCVVDLSRGGSNASEDLTVALPPWGPIYLFVNLFSFSVNI